jgi:GNAT superfamily N-acetyltransferase
VHRAPVAVRQARESDVEQLAALWDDFRLQEPLAGLAGAGPDVPERVRQRILGSDAAVEAGGPPTYRLLVAFHDGAAVGFASVSVVERGLLTQSSAVLVDVVHVADRLRNRGVGTMLLREAVAMADEIGASDVVVNTPTRGRDVNRFYARLGFAPMVVRRSASVGALRRKLGVEPRPDTTGELTPVQRSLRRRALLSPKRSTVRP